MTKTIKTLLLAGSMSVLGAGAAHAVPVGFTIGNDGNTLVRFDPNNPGALTGITITGATSTLDALAFRPNTGQLYGYDDDSDAIYLVDPLTGATTLATNSSVATDSDTLGFDFNNEVDAARIITIADQNIVFFPDESRTEAFTPVEYAEGDPNAGSGPEIVANAYTNQVPNADSTQQYGIDSELNTLVTIANNEGTLNTVGMITFDGEELDFDPNAGFDIFTNEDGENIAYLLLTTFQDEVMGIDLFTINLATAEAFRIGNFGTDFDVLSGLAVFDVDAIPVPAAGLLFLTGVGALGAARRRKKAAA